MQRHALHQRSFPRNTPEGGVGRSRSLVAVERTPTDASIFESRGVCAPRRANANYLIPFNSLLCA